MNEEDRGNAFDELARGLASGSISRDKALRLMGAALVGGALASLGIGGVADARHCKPALKKCKRDTQCCSGNCANGTCASTSIACSTQCCISCANFPCVRSGCFSLCTAEQTCACVEQAACSELQTCNTSADCPAGTTCIIGCGGKVCQRVCS